MRKFLFSLLIVFIAAGFLSAAPREEIVIKSRLFRGNYVEPTTGPDVTVTSTQLRRVPSEEPQLDSADITAITDLQREIKSLYHFNAIEHLASSNFIWDGKAKQLGQTIVLDKFTYPIHLSPFKVSKENIRLRIEIFKVNKEKETTPSKKLSDAGEKLLDMGITLKLDQSYVFGFPSNGTTFFLALNMSRKASMDVIQGIRPGNFFEVNILEPPKPLYQVEPYYPEEWEDQNIVGEVILEVSTDKEGNVTKARLIKSAHPLLDKSALDAIKKWKYEKVYKDGVPVPVIFNVTFWFRKDGPDTRI